MTPPFDIWQPLASAGLPALLMGIAVWWLQRGNSSLVAALNAERSDRLDGMEERIRDCDTDRRDLRNMLLTHLGAQNKIPIP